MPSYYWANGGSADIFLGWWYGFSTVREQKIHYIRIEKQAHVPHFQETISSCWVVHLADYLLGH